MIQMNQCTLGEKQAYLSGWIKGKWARLNLYDRGIATSEFWLTGLTIVTTICGLLTGKKAVVVAAVVAAYTISRGLKKING